MRPALALTFSLACLLSAACGDGGAGEAAKRKAAADAAKKLELAPGQWETTVEVTKLVQQDKAARPALDTPAGTKSNVSVCVTPADAKNPPALLLAGSRSLPPNRLARPHVLDELSRARRGQPPADPADA